MTLLIQTKDGLKEIEALSLFKAYDRTFFAHLSIDRGQYCVTDVKVGYRVAVGDTEKEAIKSAIHTLYKQVQSEILIPNYAAVEAKTGIVRMNLQAVAREQLDEQDGFLVCPCVMECLEDSSICRHRNRHKED